MTHFQTIRCFAALWVTLLSILLPPDWVVAEDKERVVVEGLVVAVVDQATIPATASGRISKIKIREGDQVSAGDVLGIVDDRSARLRVQLALRDLDIASETSSQKLGIESAQAALAEARQLALQHETKRKVNRRKAGNDLRIQAARKAEGVAKNEYERALAARENFNDAVSESEIESLALAHQRSQLETRQAVFENELAELDMAIDDATAESLRLQIDSKLVGVRRAESEHRIASWQADMRRHQAELANQTLDNHRLTSPINGHVVSILQHAGDWVDVGQSVARIVRIDRLRVEGFLPADRIDEIKDAKRVRIQIQQADGVLAKFSGTRRFISPEIDPVTQETRFWIEFENPDLVVQPGLSASVSVDVR